MKYAEYFWNSINEVNKPTLMIQYPKTVKRIWWKQSNKRLRKTLIFVGMTYFSALLFQ